MNTRLPFTRCKWLQMDKYQNKYRIQSARLQNWDYGWNGAYFITICTANRECFFGEIVNGNMHLSEIGKIIESEWINTFEMRPDMNLKMGEYVVMPNHFHAIIIIGKNKYNSQPGLGHGDTDTDSDTERGRDAMHCVSTTTTPNTDQSGIGNQISAKNSTPKNQYGPQSKNLASIIRGFKSSVTINARKIHTDFAWQSRFHDHIIRDDKSYQRIKNYIINNPKNWNDDTFNI